MDSLWNHFNGQLLHPKSISTAVHILEVILDIRLSYSLNIIVGIKYLKPKIYLIYLTSQHHTA